MFGKRKIKVNAIFDSQIEELLKKNSQYENLIEGNIQCKSCNCVITFDNIGIMQPIDDGTKIEFYCDRIDCLEQYKRNYE